MMLAEVTGPGWEVVAILCSVIVALLGSVTALSISRLNRQSKKIDRLCEELTNARERVAAAEARVKDFDKNWEANIPEIFERLRKLETTGEVA